VAANPVPKVSPVLRQWLNRDARDRGREPVTTQRASELMARHGAGARSELAYQWLFDAAAEPVLIIEQHSGTVIEANPAAAKLLRMPRASLVGLPFVRAFDASSAAAVQDSLAITRSSGSAQPVKVQTLDGRAELSVVFSMFRLAPDESYVLVRVSAALAADADVSARPPSAVFEAIEAATVGFVVTDGELHVQYANPAFIRMVRKSGAEDVQDEPLAHWLELSDQDQARLREQMSLRQAVTVLTTRLRRNPDPSREVEVHAVAVPDGQNPCWGFSIREIRGGASLN
jgi:PAS domain-containing protein